VGVFLSGGVLSVAAIIGFIALFGIATRNGIMIVSHIRHLMDEEGESSLEAAVVRGARERLVPILMTALATGMALVPLALAGSHPGAELEAPMAAVILFGLISATALNMIVVPIAFLKFARHDPSPTE
jgi:Cu/Ag efflux pump CusA